MGSKFLIAVTLVLSVMFQWDSPRPAAFADFTDTKNGYAFNYPVYWGVAVNTDSILSIQDGAIDLIRQEELSEADRASYKVLVHVEGGQDYQSNIAVLVSPHNSELTPEYPDSESAVQAIVSEFDSIKASGTYALEETYLGESHCYVYRRSVPVDRWDENIRITYYLAASTTHAYFLVETVRESALSEVEVNEFNQVIQSFRVITNESGSIDPGLDWGAFKPGDETAGNEAYTEIGRVQVVEEFLNNDLGWPVGDGSSVENGQYILDSRMGFPFTVRNTALGQIGFDFECLSEVTFLDGDDTAGYGLVFGYRDDDNYFGFLITRAGQYLVFEERNGIIEHLIPWTESRHIESDTHVLKVAGDYQTLSGPELLHRYAMFFYIDDNHIGNIRVERVLDMSGWYGVFVSRELNVGFEWFETRNYIEDAIMTLDRYE